MVKIKLPKTVKKPLPLSGIRRVITLICMDCPDWVIADIAGVNIKTAQF